jgi:hypothetical protein
MTNNAARDLAKNCSQLLFIDLNRCSVRKEEIKKFSIQFDVFSL